MLTLYLTFIITVTHVYFYFRLMAFYVLSYLFVLPLHCTPFFSFIIAMLLRLCVSLFCFEAQK